MSRYESDGRRSHVLVNSMSGSALRYSCRTNMLSCRKVTEARQPCDIKGCLHVDTAVIVQGAKINCPSARYDHDLLSRSANVVWVT